MCTQHEGYSIIARCSLFELDVKMRRTHDTDIINDKGELNEILLFCQAAIRPSLVRIINL